MDLKRLVEEKDGEVVAVAVIIAQPLPRAVNFDPLPFYCLATLQSSFVLDGRACEQCAKGVPVTKVRV
jgi:hypothetical protein